jgi:hypothetical protein
MGVAGSGAGGHGGDDGDSDPGDPLKPVAVRRKRASSKLARDSSQTSITKPLRPGCSHQLGNVTTT